MAAQNGLSLHQGRRTGAISMKVQPKRWLAAASVIAGIVLLVSLECDVPAARLAAGAAHAVRQAYIVQASSAAAAADAVSRAGGHLTRELAVIRAVGAELDARELAALTAAGVPQLEVYTDSAVKASAVQGTLPETYYPSEV